MNRFIRELRRREVFRTAGLYIGICWLLIEVTSVVLPTFNAPDWVLRAVIIAAVIGFPIMLVLAWIYDLSSRGIEVQADATDTVVVPFGGRRMDFIVIGVLSVALTLSVYMNLTSGPSVVEEIDPISILIADFDNQTNDPLFDGTLEQTLNMGIEGAPFITAFNRASAKSRLERLQPGSVLDDDGARLIAVREGIKLVLGGSVQEENGRYQFNVHAVNAETGERIIEADEKAADKLQVLAAVATLADRVREELGDTSFEDESIRGTETFTAGSLEAAHAYTQAQNLAYAGDYAAAIGEYEKAVALDPNFGRAHSGWALALFNLGRDGEAAERWTAALSFMDTMTERERFRTTGLYYMAVSQNYPKAIESYSSLVEKYPADGAGHNNLAVAYFSTLDFENTLAEGEAVLAIYPNNIFYQQNYALFAMYAGDFELAEATGRAVLDEDATRYYAWLPVAISVLARDDYAGAQAAYEQMAAIGANGASHANLGLADLAMYQGQYAEAVALLGQGIGLDEALGNQRAAATKRIAKAEALLGEGQSDAAVAEIEAALAANGGLGRRVPAAMLYLQLGMVDEASAIAHELTQQVQDQHRAYGNMILGIIDSREGRHAEALDKHRAAIEYTDFWLARFFLGQAYLAAGSAAEALDEFEITLARRGEASALFLDDLPTWRYLATLLYWRGRAQQAVGMNAAAAESYAAYTLLRGEDDPLAVDANERLTE
jgi:tetratricopeptide (TPR) repeat protein